MASDLAVDLMAFVLRGNLVLAVAIVGVLMLRRPVRAAFGARSAYALWLVVPLSILALLAPARTVTLPATAVARPALVAEPASPVPPPEPSVKPSRPWPLGELLLSAWLIVALAGLAIQAERQRRFVRSLGRLRGADGLLWSDRPGVGPAVIGALAPRVVLPADFAERFSSQEQALILAHERTHLAAGDAQINAAVTGLQCLFWFNPLIHLGAAVLRIDQEIACDAAVLAPPLGCHWPASANKQLKERFTLVANHHPTR